MDVVLKGHVSHVLSARMSSRPMGWSIKGGSKIVELIAYKGNDKDIKNLITFQKFLKHKDDMEYEKKIQKHKKYYIADKLKANTILTSKETKQKYAEVFSAKTGPAAYHRNGLEKDAV